MKVPIRVLFGCTEMGTFFEKLVGDIIEFERITNLGIAHETRL
jgi:hypothetical protein